MILSEKITELRKRNGLSQEEFGAEIGVSRQAVSKWEMAQSTPDLNKIMAMSDFFGVSTDFLLKDEYDLTFLEEKKADMATNNSPSSTEMIELPQIREYLDARKAAAKKFVISIFLFFLSPFAGIILSTTNASYAYGGIVIQIIVLSVMMIVLIMAIWGLMKFKDLFSSVNELAYGVRSVVEEEKKAFEHTLLIGIIIGVVSLIAFVIPLLVLSAFTENETAIIIGALVMLLIFAFGISCIIYVNTINHGYKKVLKIK